MRLGLLFLSAYLLVIPGTANTSIASAQVIDKAKSATKQSIFEGDWENAFIASRLVFRFRTENGGLVGWFVSTKNGKSYPLKDVKADGRTLSFVYKATPEITYMVKAQKGDQVLSGVWSLPNGEAVSTTLVRKQIQ